MYLISNQRKWSLTLTISIYILNNWKLTKNEIIWGKEMKENQPDIQ